MIKFIQYWFLKLWRIFVAIAIVFLTPIAIFGLIDLRFKTHILQILICVVAVVLCVALFLVALFVVHLIIYLINISIKSLFNWAVKPFKDN